ncbi:Bud site selection protein, Revert to axial protein 1, partial [Spiromyces aspiralis]
MPGAEREGSGSVGQSVSFGPDTAYAYSINSNNATTTTTTTNPFITQSHPTNTSTSAVASFRLQSEASDPHQRGMYKSTEHGDSQLRTRQVRAFDPARHLSVVSQDLGGEQSGLIRNFLFPENTNYYNQSYNQHLMPPGDVTGGGADIFDQSESGMRASTYHWPTSKPNLWNPHMLIIPPPGSGIAFANSSSPWALKLFRALPTLDDVLARRSGFPLCLYHYFTYLRDVERCENILEFWLDLSAHEELCRIYVKQLDYNSPDHSQNHASANDHSSGDPDVGMAEPILPLYYVSKRILEAGAGVDGKRASNHFNFDITNDPHLTEVSRQTALAATGPAPRCTQHRFCRIPWPSLAGSNEKHVMEITRDTIRTSAENLYYRYLVDASPREISIPDSIRNPIGEALEQDDRIDPEIFHLAKRHVYHILRDESFPRFLRDCAQYNITPWSPLPRIAVGLILLFVSFVFEFSLIFLDVQPKSWRFLPLVGFIPGWSWVLSGVKRFDPWLTLASRAELQPLKS